MTRPAKCPICGRVAGPSSKWQCSHGACPDREDHQPAAPADYELGSYTDGLVPPKIYDDH